MKEIDILTPGLVDYKVAWDLQKSIAGNLINSPKDERIENMKLILLEHPHVYTMGMHGDNSNLLFSEELLKKIGATYYKIERGGDVTYHGYGQLVGYPIIDLDYLKIGIKEYIFRLEESIIRTIAEYGIKGERDESAIGVWLDPGKREARKICAIGVKVSRFVTMHGFALNITTDLDYYRYINPCGFIDRGVTSIEKECGLKPSIDEVSKKYAVHFKEVFAL
ncbi:MAG: lipoyl(octanoyl) transferase LipB [Bacteroidales bacterium]